MVLEPEAAKGLEERFENFLPGMARRRGRRRWQTRPHLPSRPDPVYPLKIKIALDLGLIAKIREVGWGGLTSAETGRVGGLITRKLKGRKRALRLWPGRRLPLAEPPDGQRAIR